MWLMWILLPLSSVVFVLECMASERSKYTGKCGQALKYALIFFYMNKILGYSKPVHKCYFLVFVLW